MFYLNWRFTLIALAIAPVLALVVYRFTRRIKAASREVREKEGEIVSVIQEVLSAIRVVKAFAREEFEQRRLEEQSLEGVELALRARNLKAKLVPLVEMIIAVGTCLVLWFGTRMVIAGSLSAGSLILFVMYLGKMYKPMQELSKMADAYCESVSRIRADPRGARDGERSGRPSEGPERFTAEGTRSSSITSASAYEQNRPVLQDVSLTIEPGQVAALVGPTGAGKSTIISLIPRFYDPDSGAVKIDGRDIRQFRLKSLRQHMSFVLQETVLVSRPGLAQYRVRKTGSHAQGDLARGRTCQCDRIHREVAARLRHDAR